MLDMAQSPAYKRIFTPEKMKTLLEVFVENCGAFHAGTALQVVAVPADRTVWMRGCDYAGWERVPLAQYFVK